jgi:hypothetical protein
MKKTLLIIAACVTAVFISCNKEKGTVQVVEQVEVNPKTLEFVSEGETRTFSVKSNVAWRVSGESYMTFSTNGEAASDVEVTVAVTIGKNDTGAQRTGTIIISVPSGNNQTITVNQNEFIAPPGLYNAADLNDMATALTEETPDLTKWIDPASGSILVYEDIDASSLTCFPIEQLPEGTVLDGQNKTITIGLNGATEQHLALFKTLKGTVRNLTIAGTLKVDGACPHNSYYAGLAGVALNVTLENVKSMVSVNVNSSNTDASAVHVGGLIGKAASGLKMTNCTSEGEINFTSDKASYHFVGGLVGAYGGSTDEGSLIVKNCNNTGSITLNSGDIAQWNYAAGLVGNIQNASAGKHTDGSEWTIQLEDCNNSGDITLTGAAKSRISGIWGRFNGDAYVKNCKYSGNIKLNACALERNVGGITSFIEKKCNLLIEGCVMDGTIKMDEGQTKASYIGGITSSGGSANTVYDGCKTTKKSYIGCSLLGNIGMVIAQGSNALIVKNSKIAGTINAAGEVTEITADNLAPWMYLGKDSTKSLAVDGGGNVYNNE